MEQNGYPSLRNKYGKTDDLDGLIVEPTEKVIDRINADCCQSLLQEHWNFLPDTIRDLVDSGNVDVGLIEYELPLVQCIPCGDKKYAIIFSEGLRRILYSILRTYSTRLVLNQA